MDRDHVINDEIIEDNYKVFALLSNYLNHAPDLINQREMNEIVKSGVSYEYAFAVILAVEFGLDIIDHVEEKELFHNYFKRMIHHLDVNDYNNNPFYKNIKIPTIKDGNSELKYEIQNMYYHNLKTLIRLPLSKRMPLNMHENISARENMIMCLQIYGMMSLMA